MDEFNKESRLREETPPKPVLDDRPKRKGRRRGAYQTRATREENIIEVILNLIFILFKYLKFFFFYVIFIHCNFTCL